MNDESFKNKLIDRLRSGEQLEYLFFWGHRPAADGGISKSCLSQWWPSRFRVEGESFATAEHWMMAGKARLFGDEAMRARILAAETPNQAKSLGRKVAAYDEARWLEARFELVVAGNLHKFSQHPRLAAWLSGTSAQILVEASPLDPIWGIGLDEKHPDAPHPERWLGLNLLGFALMRVRDAIS